MTRLRSATERLAHAVARLESAVENRSTGSAGDSDRESLEAALAAARQERDALDADRRDVAERLDAAIERLSAVLGEDAAAIAPDEAQGDEAASEDLVAAAERDPNANAASG